MEYRSENERLRHAAEASAANSSSERDDLDLDKRLRETIAYEVGSFNYAGSSRSKAERAEKLHAAMMEELAVNREAMDRIGDDDLIELGHQIGGPAARASEALELGHLDAGHWNALGTAVLDAGAKKPSTEPHPEAVLDPGLVTWPNSAAILKPPAAEAVAQAAAIFTKSVGPEFDLSFGVAGLRCLTREIHRRNREAGWWTDLATGEPKQRNVGEMLMLVVTELAEAMEGHRKGKMDDHLPSRPMIEVELADVLVRVFDIAGGLDLDLAGAYAEKVAYNLERADHKLEARQQPGGKAI
jgi:NTP pyrophosphatase (non-canonical NTP hydrolase)